MDAALNQKSVGWQNSQTLLEPWMNGNLLGGSNPRDAYRLPRLARHDLLIQLLLPRHLECLSLCIVIKTSQPRDCGVTAFQRTHGLFNKIEALTERHNLPDAGNWRLGAHLKIQEPFRTRHMHLIMASEPGSASHREKEGPTLVPASQT